MIETITTTEANRRFSEVIRTVESGHTVVITKHGRVIARIVPERSERPERSEAHQRLIERLRTQEGFEFEPWTRDELYESVLE